MKQQPKIADSFFSLHSLQETHLRLNRSVDLYQNNRHANDSK